MKRLRGMSQSDRNTNRVLMASYALVHRRAYERLGQGVEFGWGAVAVSPVNPCKRVLPVPAKPLDTEARERYLTRARPEPPRRLRVG